MTNEFVPRIPPFSGSPITSPGAALSKSGVQWRIEKEEESEPLLKPYTKETEPDRKCYIKILSAILDRERLSKPEELKIFVELSDLIHPVVILSKYSTERGAELASTNISDLDIISFIYSRDGVARELDLCNVFKFNLFFFSNRIADSGALRAIIKKPLKLRPVLKTFEIAETITVR